MMMIVYRDAKCVAYQWGKFCITSDLINVTVHRGLEYHEAKGWYDHKGTIHLVRD